MPLGRTAAATAVLGLALILAAGAIPMPVAAGMAAAPKAYVGVFNDNGVTVIDTGTNRILTTIPIATGQG